MLTPAVNHRLIRDKAAAAKCGKSRSGFLKDLRRGLIPSPIRLGRSVRWDEVELDAWIAAGCPARARWNSLKQEGPING